MIRPCWIHSQPNLRCDECRRRELVRELSTGTGIDFVTAERLVEKISGATERELLRYLIVLLP